MTHVREWSKSSTYDSHVRVEPFCLQMLSVMGAKTGRVSSGNAGLGYIHKKPRTAEQARRIAEPRLRGSVLLTHLSLIESDSAQQKLNLLR